MPEITGVLLAAGQSRRFGDNKLLAEIDQQALILHAAVSLSPCSRLLAVVRRQDHALHQLLLDRSIELVFNDQSTRGMGSSIACAVAASRHSHGWCVLPADMPFIHPSTTQAVFSALANSAALAAPFFKGKRGHPVGFGRQLMHQLLELDSEPGARDIVTEHIEQLVKIDSSDAAVLLDIDTQQDLQKYQLDDAVSRQ